MASNLRLTFLYPHLYKNVRINDSTTKAVKRRLGRFKKETPFSTSCHREQERFTQRHGKAVEPFLPQGMLKEDVKVFVRDSKTEGDTSTVDGSKRKTTKRSTPVRKEPSSSAPLSEETQKAAVIPGDENFAARVDDSSPLTPLQEAAINTSTTNDPLSKVLLVDSETEPPIDPDIPHLATPPYVHHFDSFTLVKQIEDGGFTNAQAITAMKAVRGLLAQNLEIAKEGLVSASDVENVRMRSCAKLCSLDSC